MGIIREKQHSLGTIYERYSSKGELIQQAGAIGFVKQSTSSSIYFFIITDLKGNLIEDANYYLNNTLRGENFKKRESYFSALKLLYSFLLLFHIDSPKEMNEQDIKKLLILIEGGYKDAIAWSLESGSRDNQTFNKYLNCIRHYMKSVFRIEDNSLFDTVSTSYVYGSGLIGGHVKKGQETRYKSNKKIYEDTEVPAYISQEEYETIIKDVEENYHLRDKIIIELMYIYGMRIGEVLGLTIEDAVSLDDESFCVIIRNRYSDKPYQNAKTAMKVKSRKDYNNSTYKKDGFEIIVIDQKLYEMIQEYFEETRDPLLLANSPKKRANLQKRAIADRVGNVQLINNENQYIFLSHQYYSPLTQAGWNYIIRKLFKKAGITLDEKVKSNNLSHRFRHGFAMKKVEEGYSELKLAEALRHSGINSVKKYYNPTRKDKAKLLTEHSNKMKEEGYSFD